MNTVGGVFGLAISQDYGFIDGRMTGWRSSDRYILADYLSILGGACEVVEKYAIKLVLVKNRQKCHAFANWQKVYEDSVAKVLAKP